MSTRGHIRRVLKPMAVPKAMGSRLDATGLANTKLGIVIDGMYVVMMSNRRPSINGLNVSNLIQVFRIIIADVLSLKIPVS